MPHHSSDTERLQCLRQYHAKHQMLPSYQRVAKLLGYRSSSAASAAMKRLMATGHVQKGEGGRLSPGRRFFELPVAVGRVPAGRPVDAEDLGFTHGQIDSQLVRNPARTFILQIEGDSMVDAGLLDKDFAVVERQSHCQAGDIVVAVVDGQRTVKYLAIEKQQYFLRPANGRYKDIWPKGRLEIEGLVVASFRKIH